MTWSAKQYVAFENERTRSALDLPAAVPLAEARTMVGSNRGPGNFIEVLVQRPLRGVR